MVRHRAPTPPLAFGFGLRWRPLQLAPPDPTPPAGPTDEQIIAELAQELAASGPVSTVTAGVTAVLSTDAGIAAAVIRALLELDGIGSVLSGHTVPPGLPDPVRAQARHELTRRAAYLLSAARRLSVGLADGQLGSALSTEQRYLAQHRDAVTRRAAAAQNVADATQKLRDQHPDEPAPMLGWYSIRDQRTTAECRAAHGHNFNPAKIPVIGFPGTVHPHCRCRPGPAHPHGQFLEGSGPPAKVNLEIAAALHNGRTKAMRAIELVKSDAYPDLERVPGKQNWVDKAGGLPSYIERIAKHLHYEQGMEISRAIAVAVNTVKRWAAGGTVTEHGTTRHISPKTQALAAKAVAEWEAKKARSKG